MKTLFTKFAIYFLFLTVSQAPAGANENVDHENSKISDTTRAEFRITGTDCPVCLNRIKNKLSSLTGVVKVSIWCWSPYYGVIIYEPRKINWHVMEKAVADEHVQFVDLKECKSLESLPAQQAPGQGQVE